MPIRSKTVKANEVEHPGVILDKVLKERGISQKDLSDAIGKSTPVINDIIKKMAFSTGSIRREIVSQSSSIFFGENIDSIA